MERAPSPEQPKQQAPQELPWEQAVMQQAKYLVFQHYLGNESLPPNLGPAVPRKRKGWFPTEVSEKKENEEWSEAVLDYAHRLQAFYRADHQARPLPAYEEFKTTAKGRLAMEEARAKYGNKATVAGAMTSAAVVQEMYAARASNPVRYRAIMDQIELAEQDILRERSLQQRQIPETRHFSAQVPHTRIPEVAKTPTPAEHEAKRVERQWAEGYIRAMDRLENMDTINPEEFTEVMEKISELRRNPRLAQEIDRLREQYRTEDRGRR